jgi:hypothetical protein
MAGNNPPDQPGQRKFIRMTNAGGLDLDQHLAVARPVQIDLHDLACRRRWQRRRESSSGILRIVSMFCRRSDAHQIGETIAIFVPLYAIRPTPESWIILTRYAGFLRHIQQPSCTRGESELQGFSVTAATHYQLPQQLLAAMRAVCPEVAQDIVTHWDAPATEYAGHLFRPVAAPRSQSAGVRDRSCAKRSKRG